MPGIVEWPTVVQEGVEQFGKFFENDCQRRHFAEYVCGLIIAQRKSVAGINREFAETTDQSCLNRFLTEASWDVEALNEARIDWHQEDASTRFSERGVIAIEDLLGLSLPQHLLWMEDLTPIENFEPFSELLRKDSETKVADFMRDKFVAILPETPAIQLAKIFLMQGIRQIQVVEGSRFLGSVNLDSFISQIFWA